MESKATFNATLIDSLLEKVEQYSTSSIELIKLKAIDKIAEVVSSLVSRLAIAIVVALFTVIANIGLALWLGEITGKTYWGFFILAGFYALLAMLLGIFRKQWIKTPVSNSIIKSSLKL